MGIDSSPQRARHSEAGILVLALLSATAGLIIALVCFIQAMQPANDRISGLLFGYAAGWLVSGIVSAYLLGKFGKALELLHEIRARLPD